MVLRKEVDIQTELDRLEVELTAEKRTTLTKKAYDSLFASGDKSIYYRHAYLNALKWVLQYQTQTINGKLEWR